MGKKVNVGKCRKGINECEKIHFIYIGYRVRLQAIKTGRWWVLWDY